MTLAESHAWQLQAWAVFANHYHFVALSPPDAQTLRAFLQHLHSVTAEELNRRDGADGRKVWYQFWETHLTYQKSYFARLSYGHHNAVHHGLVTVPSAYRWCSAGWFERRASRAFSRTIVSFPWDQVKVPDDFTLEALPLPSQ